MGYWYWQNCYTRSGKLGCIRHDTNDQLLEIQILEAHELMVIPQREFKSMHRRHIFSLHDCSQCSEIVHDNRLPSQ